jgi:hypothetical protein
MMKGEKKDTFMGAPFSRALLSVWLGDHPPSEELKAGMLGRD